MLSTGILTNTIDRMFRIPNYSFRSFASLVSDSLSLVLYAESCSSIAFSWSAKSDLSMLPYSSIILLVLFMSQLILCMTLFIPNVTIKQDIILKSCLFACTMTEVVFFTDLADDCVFHRHVLILTSLAWCCVSGVHLKNQQEYYGLPSVDTIGIFVGFIRMVAGAVRAGVSFSFLASCIAPKALLSYMLSSHHSQLSKTIARNTLCKNLALSSLLYRLAASDHRVPASVESESLRSDISSFSVALRSLIPSQRKFKSENARKRI